MKCTVWRNYHDEGWSPEEFEDEAAAAEFIRKGTHSEVRVTRDLSLKIVEEP